MNRRGVLLPLILVGMLAIIATVPYVVSDTETEVKNLTAIDESNKIYWAAEGAACNAYEKCLKINPVRDMEDLSINIKNENIIATEAPIFKYNNSFVATTTVDTQSTLHEERACWLATSGAKDYDFQDKIKVLYVKPGVGFNRDDGYAWDKNGILYKIDNNKLVKHDKIKTPVWQGSRYFVIDADGKAINYSDGSEYSDNAINIHSLYATNNNDIVSKYRLTKNGTILNSNNELVKWKDFSNASSTGILDDIVQIDGRYAHMFALKSNGDLYGWGENEGFKQGNTPDCPVIRKLGEDNKTRRDPFTDQEAVLINTLHTISNSFYNLTYFIDKEQYLNGSKDGFFINKFGKTPHHCKNHEVFTEGCEVCIALNEHPWTDNRIKKTYHFLFFQREYDYEDQNCMCKLCKEFRDIDVASKTSSLIFDFTNLFNVETKLDPRSTHTDTCHCDYCWDEGLQKNRICLNGALNPILCDCWVCTAKREHFWGCHCEDCEKNKKEFYNDDANWATNIKTKVPNPSTPLHLENDTKIVDLQLLVDGNSAFCFKDSFYNKNNIYRSDVEFRAKFLPKNRPTTHTKGDVGTYKYGITTDNFDEIYLVEDGYTNGYRKITSSEKKCTIDNLPNVWLVRFGKTKPATIKKGGEIVDKFPAGDYEVIFEYRLKIEEKNGANWFFSKHTDWKIIEPYNLFWGVDRKGISNNNKYFGCIFRLNEFFFNITSGRIWEPHKTYAVSAGQYFSVILAKNTDDAVVNRNKYKVVVWGARKDYRLGYDPIFEYEQDRGDMIEVEFEGDDKKNDNYVAKHVRSIKTGKSHTLVFTDYKDNNNKRIQELWTWGANKFARPVKLNLQLDAPIVSIACGDSKNLLITENDTVYQWNCIIDTVDSSKIIPRK